MAVHRARYLSGQHRSQRPKGHRSPRASTQAALQQLGSQLQTALLSFASSLTTNSSTATSSQVLQAVQGLASLASAANQSSVALVPAEGAKVRVVSASPFSQEIQEMGLPPPHTTPFAQNILSSVRGLARLLASGQLEAVEPSALTSLLNGIQGAVDVFKKRTTAPVGGRRLLQTILVCALSHHDLVYMIHISVKHT